MLRRYYVNIALAPGLPSRSASRRHGFPNLLRKFFNAGISAINFLHHNRLGQHSPAMERDETFGWALEEGGMCGLTMCADFALAMQYGIIHHGYFSSSTYHREGIFS